MGPLEKTLSLAERIFGISDFQRCIEVCYAIIGVEGVWDLSVGH